MGPWLFQENLGAGKFVFRVFVPCFFSTGRNCSLLLWTIGPIGRKVPIHRRLGLGLVTPKRSPKDRNAYNVALTVDTPAQLVVLLERCCLHLEVMQVLLWAIQLFRRLQACLQACLMLRLMQVCLVKVQYYFIWPDVVGSRNGGFCYGRHQLGVVLFGPKPLMLKGS